MSEEIINFEKRLMKPKTSFKCLNCSKTVNITSFNTFKNSCQHEQCLDQFAFEDQTNFLQLQCYLQIFVNKIHNLLILLPTKIESPEQSIKTQQYFIKKEQIYSNLIKKVFFNKRDIKHILDFYITYYQIFNKNLIAKGLNLGINDLIKNYQGKQLYNEELKNLYEIRYSLLIPSNDLYLITEGKEFRVFYNKGRLVVYNIKESKVESALAVHLPYKNKPVLVEPHSLVIYFFDILYLWNYQKHSFIDLPFNFSTQISKIFVFNDTNLVACAEKGIKIWNIIEKTLVSDIEDIVFANPCPSLNRCEKCLYFNDYQNKVYFFNIKNKIFGIFAEHNGKILEAALLNTENSLVLFCELSTGNHVQIWNTENRELVYNISENKLSNYYFGKARILPETNFIFFKYFSFDVKNLRLQKFQYLKCYQKVKKYKKLFNLNGESLSFSKDRLTDYGNTSHFYLNKETKIIYFIFTWGIQIYLEFRTTKNKILKQLKFIKIIHLKEIQYKQEHIVLKSYYNQHYLNWPKELLQVNFETNGLKKVKKSKKYSCLVINNKFNVFKNIKNKLDTFALSSHFPISFAENSILIAYNNSLSKVNTENFEITAIPQTLVSEKILYLELIDSNQVFITGESKSYIYNLNLNLVSRVISHKTQEKIKKVSFVKNNIIVIQGMSEFIIIQQEHLSILMYIQLKLDENYCIEITNNQKYLLIIHHTQTVICNLEVKVYQNVLYSSHPSIKYKVNLELSGFLMLVIRVPKQKLEELSETSVHIESKSNEKIFFLVSLENPNSTFMKCSDKNLRIQIINNQYLLFNDICKIINPLNDFEEIQLNIEDFDYFAGGPKIQETKDWVSSFIQDKKSKGKNSIKFHFAIKLVGLNFIKISENKKKLYLCGINYRLLIINLKKQFIQAIFFDSVIESIKNIFEFQDQKFILLASSRRIMKFDQKTYSRSIIIQKLKNFSYYTIYKNRFLFAKNPYPTKNPRLLFFDIYENKILEIEKYNTVHNCKIAKIGKFLLIIQNKIINLTKKQSSKSNTLIDLDHDNGPLISDFKHVNFLRCSSSKYKGTKKINITKYFKFYLSANKKKLIAVENSYISIVDMDSLEIKAKFSMEVSPMIFSNQREFIILIHNKSCIQCIDLITLKIKILYNSLHSLQLMGFSSDHRYILSYQEETFSVNRHYIG